jgi:hypothetical protein
LVQTPQEIAGTAVSLKTRTLITIVLAVTAIIGVADGLRLWNNRADRIHQLDMRAALVVAIQADALVQPLWDFAKEQIDAVLAALVREILIFLRPR